MSNVINMFTKQEVDEVPQPQPPPPVDSGGLPVSDEDVGLLLAYAQALDEESDPLVFRQLMTNIKNMVSRWP